MRGPIKRPLVLALACAVLAVTLSTPGAVTGAQEPDLATPALTRFGPTAKPPSGGVLPRRLPGATRWKYRGTLGKLGNNEQVVAPVIAPPERLDRRAPLTGRKIRKTLDRPAIVVKIDNVAPARPQTGINQADIVYEELVEGGQTRLAAVFHSKAPSVIGPVRSARSTDIGIAVSFARPIFAFSGANSVIERLVNRARVVVRDAEVTFVQGYFRGGPRPAPHNLYTRASTLLRSVDSGNPPPPHFVYRATKASPERTIKTAKTVQLKFERKRGITVRYEWDERIGGWRRWQSGRAHTDVAGVQVAPENVVIQIVPYTDAGLTDKFGEDLYEAQLVGTGRALVFTDGHVIEATWTKPTLRSVTTFTDRSGQHVKLTRGRTWVSLVPPGGVSFDAEQCNGRIATVAGTRGEDLITGTTGRDVIAAVGGGDVVLGGGGDDLICGGRGDDRLFADAGRDTVFGGPGADDLRGGVDDDLLDGGVGNDQLHGQAGSDVLVGRGGADVLIGQPGVDRFVGASNDIRIWGD